MRVADFKGVLSQTDYDRVAAVVSDGDLEAAVSQKNVSGAVADALIAASEDGKQAVPATAPAAAPKKASKKAKGKK